MFRLYYQPRPTTCAYLTTNLSPHPHPHAMSLSSFSSLSSYTSESDISTLLNLDLFKKKKKTSSSRAHAHAHARRRRRSPSPEPPRLKDRRSSPARHTRRGKRISITPTRTPTTPVSSSRYDRALVPYSPQRSPGSKSGVTYSDIDRWRAATVGGSDFTYSSESSVTVSSVTASSFVSNSSRTRSSRIDGSSSRRSIASGSRWLDVPASHAPQHPRLGIRHDPSQICEHCRTAQYILLPLSHR